MNSVLVPSKPLSKEEIEKRLAELREKWKTANEVERKLLRARGILLRRALKSL